MSFLKNRSGTTATEYCLIATLIVVVAISFLVDESEGQPASDRPAAVQSTGN